MANHCAVVVPICTRAKEDVNELQANRSIHNKCYTRGNLISAVLAWIL